MLTSISEDYVLVLERAQTSKNKKNQSEATNLEAAWVSTWHELWFKTLALKIIYKDINLLLHPNWWYILKIKFKKYYQIINLVQHVLLLSCYSKRPGQGMPAVER